MRKQNNDDFELVNNYELPEECNDPEITQEDFVLSKENEGVHEQHFVTKPTTFFKDSLRRFAKNKSSVVAAYILGALVLLGFIVPLCIDSVERSPFNTRLGPEDPTYYMNLEPRLFSNAGGFWDGTVEKKHIPINKNTGYPDPTYYSPSGIKMDTYVETKEYTNEPNRYGEGGYFEIGFYGQYFEMSEAYAELTSTNIKNLKLTTGGLSETFIFNLNTTNLTLKSFETVNGEMIKEYEKDSGISTEGINLDIPQNTVLGEIALKFNYTTTVGTGDEAVTEEHTITLVEAKEIQNVSNLDLNPIILEKSGGLTSFKDGYFSLVVTPKEDTPEKSNVISLVKSMCFDLNDDAPELAKMYFLEANTTNEIPGLSFTNAMDMGSRTSTMQYLPSTPKTVGYWAIPNLTQYIKTTYLGKSAFADFTYDTYEGALGEQDEDLPFSYLQDYVDKGYCEYTISATRIPGSTEYQVNSFTFRILNPEKCPIKDIEGGYSKDNIFNYTKTQGKESFTFSCKVYKYRVLGMDEMPRYLFGTDKSGRDMLKYTFEGLRNSLLLGIVTFAICFAFGLVWGAISGYFGGTVDLLMERFTDILSGIPWIVAMTLIVLKTNSRSFGTFLFALCITGWIGTASRTRTQFYRFRGREYVLASRTLGASDARLIAKHILPNSLGTIITGAVLMIPSVIFSEATISYLGLGFQDLSSLGVILSNNQSELTSHPYQLIFPSVIIALLMISFNLFGNGLRDAINPSLKGEEE